MSEECKGCPIYGKRKPNPIPGVVTNAVKGEVEVLFVGHAFNFSAAIPFQGAAGKYLRKEIERLDIDSFLITNIYKCRLSFQTEYSGPRLGGRCFNLLMDELKYNPRLVVALGSPSSQILAYKNVHEMPDEVTTDKSRWYWGPLIAVPHPSAISTHSNVFLQACWDRRWKNITEFLWR